MVRGLKMLAAGFLLAAAGLYGAAPDGQFRNAPDSVVDAIQRAIEAGRSDEAMGMAERALRTYPGDAAILNLRGVLHAQRKETAAARADFAAAVKRDPGMTAAWRNLGRACGMELGREPGAGECALRAWRKVLERSPGDGEARYMVAAIEEGRKHYRESLAELHRLPAPEMERSQTLALECADWLGLGKMPEAEAAAGKMTRAAEFDARDAAVVLPLSEGKAGAGVTAIVVEALKKQGAAGPGDLRRLVVAYEDLGRLKEARSTLEELAAAEPGHVEHLFELARVAYRMHDLEGSLGYLAHARDLEPGNARVHFLFGMVLVELKLPVEARKSLEKAVALEPANAEYNYALGAAILSSRDANNAVPRFQKYVDARPGDPRGRFALGVAEFAAGDYEGCRKQMEAVEKDPETSAGAAYFLGRVAFQNEEYEAAATELEAAVKLRPDFAEAFTELARVRMKQGRIEQARAAVTRAMELKPDSYQANGALLALYEKTHDARTEAQREKLSKMDAEREKEEELMVRSIVVKPY